MVRHLVLRTFAIPYLFCIAEVVISAKPCFNMMYAMLLYDNKTHAKHLFTYKPIAICSSALTSRVWFRVRSQTVKFDSNYYILYYNNIYACDTQK